MEFYELKAKIETIGGETYFFSADTLRFFGESLSSMRLLKGTSLVTDIYGNKKTCHVISAKRRKNAFGPCKPYTVYHYFDTTSFQRIIH